MDFNFRAPSPMFKEMNRLESPSLFFDDFKVDVNVSPSRFFTTTPPLWSPTKSLQESSSPTKSLLTNESPTFNCFVDNIQPNGLIPFKPQVVKLEDNLLTSSIERPNVSTTEEGTQQQKNPLLNLESKGGAFEKFNKPGLDINNNQTNQQNSFLNSAFSKIENSINIPEPNPLVKLEHPTTTNNPNPTNMTNNNNTNNNNLNNNTNNNNNNLQRNNNNPPGISNNSMFNNLSQQNKNMPNPFFPNDFSGMNLMFGGGPNSAFSKMDNMPLFNQSLMTNGFPSNGMGNMNNMGTNMKQGQGFHPNMMQMNPAMMQMMQMQMQMQNPNLLNIHPNNNNGNNNNTNNLNNNNNNNMNNNPNNNLNNMNNNMKQMGGGDSRFIKFESIVPMMNSTDNNNNKPNMSPNMNPNFNNMNPNMFFSVPTNPNMNNMNNINMNLNPNLNGNFLTRAKNPLEQSNEEKNVPNKRQKNKKSTDTKNTKNKDTNKHIKPKFTTEVNKNDLDLIQKKRTLDTQSPTFTDDGHLKNRVKEKKEVPDKIQCLGSSKKKGTQCKNAALLEYIGPRPLYCAEHIEEDKNTLHGKCKCTYFKEKGDGKPCKQIILKELVMCYRHFDEVLPTLTLEKARRQKNLVVEMIKKLRQDSKTFLKTNIDLYQRKSKLLPKYIKLDNILAKFIAEKEKTE